MKIIRFPRGEQVGIAGGTLARDCHLFYIIWKFDSEVLD